MAVLTGTFLRFKLSHVLRDTNGRDGSPINNDYSFLINHNRLEGVTKGRGILEFRLHVGCGQPKDLAEVVQYKTLKNAVHGINDKLSRGVPIRQLLQL